MKSRVGLTLLNWRWWLALPLLCVMFPVLVAQAICRGAAIVFDAADEAIEYTFGAPARRLKNFIQRNKQEEVTP